MKVSSVLHAIVEFEDFRKELEPLIEQGVVDLTCLVRQHHHMTGEDQGWAFKTLSAEESLTRGEWVVWGELDESRKLSDGTVAQKTVRIYLDPETIDSIEFERYDSRESNDLT